MIGNYFFRFIRLGRIILNGFRLDRKNPDFVRWQVDADALAGLEVVVRGEDHKTGVPAFYPDAGGAAFEIRFGYFSLKNIFCIRRQQDVFRTYGGRPHMPVAGKNHDDQ